MNVKRFKANVTWFDRNTGEGMIYIPKLKRNYVIYACNIKGKKTWYAETACVYYKTQQKITVEMKWDDYSCFAIGLTKGIFDKDKWNKLDHDKLAFRCDENGKATSGLLPPGTMFPVEE